MPSGSADRHLSGSNAGAEANWRAALTSHYQDSEYQELMQTVPGVEWEPGTRKILEGRLFVAGHRSEGHGDERNELFDTCEGFRFPPVPQPTQLSELRVDEFVKTVSEDKWAALSSAHSSILLEECYAGLRFLEAMLKTFAVKTAELRHSIVEHIAFLHSLTRPPQTQDDAEYLEQTIFNNLSTLYDELQELLAEMNVFQATKIHEMIDTVTEQFDSQEPIYALKESLIARSSRLADEVSLSIFSIEHLVAFTNSLIRFPAQDTPLVEALHVDWQASQRLLSRLHRSPLSEAFLLYMLRHRLPVCDQVYSFLETMRDSDRETSDNLASQTFAIVNYSFARNELKHILLFLRIQDSIALQRQQQQSELSLSPTVSSRAGTMPSTPSAAFAWAVGSAWSSSVLQRIGTVRITRCQLADQDCHALAATLPFFSMLTLLDVSHNRLGYSSVASLCTQWFDRLDVQLRVLNLSHNRIDSDSAKLLAQVLPRLPRLQWLSLSHNPIGDIGLLYILKATLNIHRKVYRAFPRAKQLKARARVLKQEEKRYGFSSVIRGSKNGQTKRQESLNEANEEAKTFPASESEDNDENDSDSDAPVDDRHRHNSPFRRHGVRYASKCYWQDFFVKEIEHVRVDEAEDEAQAVDARWVNEDEDEFDLDIDSEYSDSEDLLHELDHSSRDLNDKTGLGNALLDDLDRHSIASTSIVSTALQEETVPSTASVAETSEAQQRARELARERERERQREEVLQRKQRALIVLSEPLASAEDKRKALHGFSFREKLVLVDPVLAARATKRAATSHVDKATQLEQARQARIDEIRQYPRFVQVLLRIRLKLVAVSMFQRLRLRATMDLQALHVSNCALTSIITPALSLTVQENHWLRELRLSDNPKLLCSLPACEAMQSMLRASTGLRVLDIARCGLREAGLMLLCEALEKPAQPHGSLLQSLDVSYNQLGPTAANVIANLHKTFYADVLQIGPALRNKSAPSLQKDLQENWKWDELLPVPNSDPQRPHARGVRKHDKTQSPTRSSRRRAQRSSSASFALSEEYEDGENDDVFVDRDLFDGDEDEDDNEDNDGHDDDDLDDEIDDAQSEFSAHDDLNDLSKARDLL